MAIAPNRQRRCCSGWKRELHEVGRGQGVSLLEVPITVHIGWQQETIRLKSSVSWNPRRCMRQPDPLRAPPIGEVAPDDQSFGRSGPSTPAIGRQAAAPVCL